MDNVATSLSLRRVRRVQRKGGPGDEVMRTALQHALDAIPTDKHDITDAELDNFQDLLREAYNLPPQTDQERQESKREGDRILATLEGKGYIFTKDGLERLGPANS